MCSTHPLNVAHGNNNHSQHLQLLMYREAATATAAAGQPALTAPPQTLTAHRDNITRSGEPLTLM